MAKCLWTPLPTCSVLLAWVYCSWSGFNKGNIKNECYRVQRLLGRPLATIGRAQECGVSLYPSVTTALDKCLDWGGTGLRFLLGEERWLVTPGQEHWKAERPVAELVRVWAYSIHRSCLDQEEGLEQLSCHSGTQKKNCWADPREHHSLTPGRLQGYWWDQMSYQFNTYNVH